MNAIITRLARPPSAILLAGITGITPIQASAAPVAAQHTAIQGRTATANGVSPLDLQAGHGGGPPPSCCMATPRPAACAPADHATE